MSSTSSHKPRKQLSNKKKEMSKKSILLSVPIYFYLDFFKMYQTPIIFYIAGLIGIVLGYIYVPFNSNEITRKLSHDFSVSKYDIQKLDSTCIQSYSPKIYEELLKELRQMQQATINIQIKQQATDRKTQALQRTLHTLKTSICDGAGNSNDEKTKNMIKDALLVYDADKLGLRDYALESLGGNIISIPNTTPKLSQIQYVLFGFISLQSYSNPREVIQADVLPGKCFAFEGEQGKLRIKLSNEIFISAVTLENAPKSLLTQNEIASAPHHFKIIGLENAHDDNGIILGHFIYTVDGPPRQTFLIVNDQESKSFQFVELHILNNHGNVETTCVYRVRIHGQVKS